MNRAKTIGILLPLLILAAALAHLVWIGGSAEGPGRTGSAPSAPDRPRAGLEAAPASWIDVTVSSLPAHAIGAWEVLVRGPSKFVRRIAGAGERTKRVGVAGAGTYEVVLRAAGYVGASRKLTPERGGVSCALEARKLAEVRGTLTRAEGGEGIAGARVRAFPLSAREGWLLAGAARKSLLRNAESDRRGEYELKQMIPGVKYRLGIYHPEFRPLPLQRIVLEAGEVRTLSLSLAKGAHLVGRLLDVGGKAVPGATVHFLRKKGHGWIEEGSTRTDKSGRFRSPALIPGETVQVKAWWLKGGENLVAQAVAHVPAEGERSLGDLQPWSGRAEWRIQNPEAGIQYTLTFADVPEGNDPDQALVLSGVAFDAMAGARLLGLQPGSTLQYVILDGRNEAVASGTFVMDAPEKSVAVEVVSEAKGRRRSPPSRAVSVTVSTQETCDLLLVGPRGALIRAVLDAGKRSAERDSEGRVRVSTKLPDGRYTAYAITGKACGVEEFEVGPGAGTVSVSLGRPVRRWRLRVTEGGRPAKGARVYLVGFGAVSAGLHAPWGTADENGEVVLRPLPESVRKIDADVLNSDGEGKAFVLAPDRREVDLPR